MLVSAIVFGEEAVRKLMACTKGDSVCIGGRGALKSWTGNDGSERTGLNVTAT
jgi:single-stranded DNA-binding protein